MWRGPSWVSVPTESGFRRRSRGKERKTARAHRWLSGPEASTIAFPPLRMLSPTTNLLICFYPLFSVSWLSPGRRGSPRNASGHAPAFGTKESSGTSRCLSGVGKGALAPASESDFLAELLVKLVESCYIGTGSLDCEFALFFHL
jgi:hypothetical protein